MNLNLNLKAILTFMLLLLAAHADAHNRNRVLAYQGPSTSHIVWVGVEETTTIVVPSAIERIVTTLSDADISYVLQDRRLLFTPLRKNLKQSMLIYLADGRLFELRVRDKALSQHTRQKADARVEVTDSGHKAERVRVTQKTTLAPPADPRRVLIRAMWLHHLPLPDGVFVKSENTVLSTSKLMELRRIRVHDVSDYYGHTLLVTNRSKQTLPLDITSFSGKGLILAASNLLKPTGAVPGDVVEPGGKALVYLIYRGTN